MERKSLIVSSLSGYADEIGRFLWCLEDVRHKLLTEIAGISQSILDRRLGERQSIGSLLYHIALIEADWLYVDVLGTEWDPEIISLFPVDNLTDGQLTHFEGDCLEQHVSRLNKVREKLLSYLRPMDLNQWRKPRVLEHYEVTPEWVVYHLIEHESNHRGQIFQLLRELRNE